MTTSPKKETSGNPYTGPLRRIDGVLPSDPNHYLWPLQADQYWAGRELGHHRYSSRWHFEAIALADGRWLSDGLVRADESKMRFFTTPQAALRHSAAQLIRTIRAARSWPAGGVGSDHVSPAQYIELVNWVFDKLGYAAVVGLRAHAPTASADDRLLRTCNGEPPLGRDAAFFLDHQGEIFDHDNPRYRSSATRIGVLALDNGRWLALPPGFAVQQKQHDSRDQALRVGIGRMIRRARRYRRNGEGEGTHWNEGYAGRVIEWALNLNPGRRRPPVAGEQPSSRMASEARANGVATSGAPALPRTFDHGATTDDAAGMTDDCSGGPAGAVIQPSQTDPVIRALCEANKARKIYPDGHNFSMTNPIVNGQMVTLGTCECGDSFSYSYGSYERMDAAIEAHWQKFDHLPEKVDGRGQPIGAAPKARKTRKPKTPAHDAGLFAAATSGSATDPPGPASEPAPSTLSGAGEIQAASIDAASTGRLDDLVSVQAAQICASAEDVDGRDKPGHDGGDDLDDLAIDWPSYDAFLEDKIVTAPLRGIEVSRDALHPWLKPHCKDLVVWALRLGCSAIFASFGLHKTAMQLEWTRQLAKHTGQPTLSVVPLGVRHGFIKEALQLDMDVRFIRTTEELDDLYGEGVRHFLTNYESIREGKLDPNAFEAVTLDEASVLRSYGSKTFQEFLPLFAKVPFRLVGAVVGLFPRRREVPADGRREGDRPAAARSRGIIRCHYPTPSGHDGE